MSSKVIYSIRAIYNSVFLAVMYIFGSHVKYRVSIEQYPDIVSGKTDKDLFPKTKGFLINDLKQCIGCGDCIDICSVSALKMQADRLADGSMHVRNFDIDLGRCYLCSACVNVCPVSSITYTKSFEMIANNTSDLVIHLDENTVDSKRKSFVASEKSKMRTYEVRR